MELTHPLMILAGFQTIGILLSGARDMAQIYLDGGIWYVPDTDFQKMLDAMVEAEAITTRIEGPYNILVYTWPSWRVDGIYNYRKRFETEEYRQWVNNSQAVLTDFANQEFDKNSLVDKYGCTEEQAEFYIRYLQFSGKVQYIYDKNSKTGVWVIKVNFREKVSRVLGLKSYPTKLERK